MIVPSERPPEGAVDCHLHVVDPAAYPYDDGPGYKPGEGETGTAAELEAALTAAGVGQALLVQPSCYGTDNSAMLAAMRARPGAYKAIAVVAPDIADSELEALDAAGVVGVRLNVVNMGVKAIQDAVPLADRLRELGWIMQIQCPAGRLPELAGPILDSGVQVVLDHLGYPEAGLGACDPSFRAMLETARNERVSVKLSGAFRLSCRPCPHTDLDAIAAEVIAAFGPARCVWGSDWPFVGVVDRPVYSETLAMLERWAPDAADRQTVLVEAPRRLFGFAPIAAA